MLRYYNIKIDQNVRNFNEGFTILFGAAQKLHAWDKFANSIPNLQKEGKSQRGIARLFGVSPEAIRQYLERFGKHINERGATVARGQGSITPESDAAGSTPASRTPTQAKLERAERG